MAMSKIRKQWILAYLIIIILVILIDLLVGNRQFR